jgi:hypothetical protein
MFDWERGKRKSGGPALKLLNVIQKHGLKAVAWGLLTFHSPVWRFRTQRVPAFGRVADGALRPPRDQDSQDFRISRRTHGHPSHPVNS